MCTLTLRNQKQSALTFTEADTNFINLNTDKVEKTAPVFTGNLSADFSNATLTSRIYAQTSTAGGNTSFGAVPNGAGTNSEFRANNIATPTNAAYGALQANATNIDVISAASGSGTALPMRLICNSNTGVTIDTSGNVTVATQTAGNNTTRVASTAFVTTALTGAAVVTMGDMTTNNTSGALLANHHYFIDSPAGGGGGQLPVGPSNGDIVIVTNCGTTALTIDRNGKSINGAASNDTIAATVGTTKRYRYDTSRLSWYTW